MSVKVTRIGLKDLEGYWVQVEVQLNEGLDGTILPVEGMIAAILAEKKLKLKKLFPPFDRADIELKAIETLQDVMDYLAGRPMLPLFSRGN